jgi:hypothetical protein
MLARSPGWKRPCAASASFWRTPGGFSPSALSQSGQTKVSSSARSRGESLSIASLISATVLMPKMKPKVARLSMGEEPRERTTAEAVPSPLRRPHTQLKLGVNEKHRFPNGRCFPVEQICSRRAGKPGKSTWNHEIHETHETDGATEIWCHQGVHPTGEPCPFRKPFNFRVFGVFRGLICRCWD